MTVGGGSSEFQDVKIIGSPQGLEGLKKFQATAVCGGREYTITITNPDLQDTSLKAQDIAKNAFAFLAKAMEAKPDSVQSGAVFTEKSITDETFTGKSDLTAMFNKIWK